MTAMPSPLAQASPNGILTVAAAALNHPAPVRMWFGESDLPTPPCVTDAVQAALSAGKTFYAPRRGLPELRDELGAYMRRLYGETVDQERITVTSSGMNAIMVALQAVGATGGNVIVVAPVWPNITNAVVALGAECRHVRLDEGPDGWRLDLDRLFDRCDADTRAIFLASPANPTGWVCPTEQQRAILAFCSARGIVAIADEVYQRIVYDGTIAPSFLQVADADAPLIVVNSFSKTWAMTGWRMGWLIHPIRMASVIGELNAVNNTGPATFVQWAGLAAVRDGEPFVAALQDYCRRGRERTVARLADMPRVRLHAPAGAMYAFFGVDGVTDSLGFACELAAATGIGLAPGSAFGTDNEGYFRLCFALDGEVLGRALDGLGRFVVDWFATPAPGRHR